MYDTHPEVSFHHRHFLRVVTPSAPSLVSLLPILHPVQLQAIHPDIDSITIIIITAIPVTNTSAAAVHNFFGAAPASSKPPRSNPQTFIGSFNPPLHIPWPRLHFDSLPLCYPGHPL